MWLGLSSSVRERHPRLPAAKVREVIADALVNHGLTAAVSDDYSQDWIDLGGEAWALNQVRRAFAFPEPPKTGA